MVLIEDEDATLEELGVCDDDQILIELQNKDLTWPEEMESLALTSANDRHRQGNKIFFKKNEFIQFLVYFLSCFLDIRTVLEKIMHRRSIWLGIRSKSNMLTAKSQGHSDHSLLVAPCRAKKISETMV